MPKESFTVVYNVRRYNVEPNVPPGSKILTEAEALPPKELVSGITGTHFGGTIVTLEAGTAAEALKAAARLYRFDSGVGFAIKTSSITWESI